MSEVNKIWGSSERVIGYWSVGHFTPIAWNVVQPGKLGPWRPDGPEILAVVSQPAGCSMSEEAEPLRTEGGVQAALASWHSGAAGALLRRRSSVRRLRREGVTGAFSGR